MDFMFNSMLREWEISLKSAKMRPQVGDGAETLPYVFTEARSSDAPPSVLNSPRAIQ